MADTGSVDWAGLLGSALSTGMQAYGYDMQGKSQQAAYDYNAGMVETVGEQNIKDIEFQEEEFTSTQVAMTAKAGVALSGSPIEAIIQSRTNFEIDKAVSDYNTESKAIMLRYQGKTARNTANFNMGETLLKGGISGMSATSKSVWGN